MRDYLRALSGAIAAAVLLHAPGPSLGSEAAANRLFVEAALLVDDARDAPPVEAIDLYRQALNRLDKIIDDERDSRLAVELVSGQSVGDISRDGVFQLLRGAIVAACPDGITVVCVLTIAYHRRKDYWIIENIRDTMVALAPVDAAMTFAESLLARGEVKTIDDWRAALAAREAAAGRAESAEILIGQIDVSAGSVPHQAAVLAHLVVAHTELGDRESAQSALAKLRQLGGNDDIVRQLAEAEFAAGNSEAAAAAIARIASSEKRAWALAALVETATRAESFDAAEHLLEQIGSGETGSVANAIRSIASAHARAGRIDAAEDMVGRIAEADTRMRILLSIAADLPAYSPAVDRLIGSALKIAGTTKANQCEVLATAATINARFGRLDAARDFLDQAKETADRLNETDAVIVADSLIAARVSLGDTDAVLIETIQADNRLWTIDYLNLRAIAWAIGLSTGQFKP